MYVHDRMLHRGRRLGRHLGRHLGSSVVISFYGRQLLGVLLVHLRTRYSKLFELLFMILLYL